MISTIKSKKGMEGMERYGKGLSPLGSMPRHMAEGMEQVCLVDQGFLGSNSPD